MRRHSFLAVALGALTAVVLLASRCSDDDEKRAGPSAAAVEEPVPGAVGGSGLGKVDGGVEKDPMDGAMGAEERPLEDPDNLPPQSGDSLQDDQTFEPQPVPENTKGL